MIWAQLETLPSDGTEGLESQSKLLRQFVLWADVALAPQHCSINERT